MSEKVLLEVIRWIFRGHSADHSVSMIFGVFASGDRLHVHVSLTTRIIFSLSHDDNQTKIVTTANTTCTL